MLKKLLVALFAAAFALSVSAQAPKSGTEKAEPKGQTGETTKKAEPGKGQSAAKATDKKAKPKTKAAKTTKGDTKKDAAK